MHRFLGEILFFQTQDSPQDLNSYGAAQVQSSVSLLFNPILGGYFMYVGWGVVQNYPKSLNKGNKLISHKNFQNTSSL